MTTTTTREVCPRCGRGTPAPIAWRFLVAARSLALGVIGAIAALAIALAAILAATTLFTL